ncbi:MAG: hypothetical protein R3E76_09300 [Planctomycetota bacterium]
MADPTIFADVLHCMPTLLRGAFRALAQTGQPLPPEWDDFEDPYYNEPEPEFPFGALIIGFLVSIGIQVLFGLWGKSRAEDHNVHPLAGFLAGFFLGWIGVLLVPVFKTDRIVNKPARTQFYPQMQSAPNPVYTAGTPMSQQAPPPGYPQPPMAPPPQGAYPMAPQQHPHMQPPPMAPQMQQPMAPPPQPAMPDMLVADDSGYVVCPSCQSRTKAGRKACMSCGNFLPPIFDPNVG